MPERKWSLRLSRAERWKFFQAGLALPLVSLGLRFFGFKRCHAFLGRGAPAGYSSPPPVAEDEMWWRARRLALVVRRAVRRNPFPSTCLHRSLVLWWLLRREGLPAELRIGVRKPGGQFEAHAWVEYQGRPLNDRPQVREEFATFPQAITTAMFTKD